MLYDKILTFLGLRNFFTDKNDQISMFNTFLKSKNKPSLSPKKRVSQPREIIRSIYNKDYGSDISPLEKYRRLDIKIDTNIDKPLNIDKPPPSSKYCFHKILYISYVCLIVCILSWRPFHNLGHSIINKDVNSFLYLSSFFFQITIPILYIFSIRYFSTDHFDTFYIQSKSNDILNIDSVCKIIIVCVVLIVIYRIIVINIQTFSIEDDEFYGYDNLEPYQKGLMSILLIITWTYAKLFLLLITSCFVLVFHKHSIKLLKYSKKIEKINVSSIDTTINSILIELGKLKYKIETSVNYFSYIFSTYSICGAIGIGLLVQYIIKQANIVSFPWIQILIYLIVQLSFFISVFRMNYYKSNVIDTIRDPDFSKRFLTRYTIKETEDKFKANKEYIILNLLEENASSMDWLVLIESMTDKWAQFSIFGFPLDDGELIKRGLALVALFVTLTSS